MSTVQQCYLMEMTVAIPKDEQIIIRNEKRVEYQTERVYLPGEKNSRVKRRTIGKVDPVNPERMFPNEAYFELFPENEVPKEIRDEFLRDCAFRRALRGMRTYGDCSGLRRDGGDGSVVTHSRDEQNNSTFHRLHPPLAAACETPPVPQIRYVLVRRLFDEMYFAIEELAGKFPNEVMDSFKAEKINEVLKEIRGMVEDEKMMGYLRLIDEPEVLTEKGETVTKGLTYSDVLLLMKWYKVLPR